VSNRRDFLKQTGVVGAGIALGGVTPAAVGVMAVAAQDATLDFWDTTNDPIKAEVITGLGNDFGEANGVTVSHRGWTLEELQDTLPRVVESNQGPDVAQINNGESLMGPMVRAGQILSLKDYDAQYGWSERFAPSLLARNMYTADGATFGEGELWGLSAESEIVGFFYNKQIFSDAGVSVPTTFAEFETALATLRDAGIPALLLGNLDKFQAIHLFGELQGTSTTREYLDDLIYRRNDKSFDDPSMLFAANKLIEWKEAGYFLDGFDGISSDDAVALFASGAGAILLQGSWATPSVIQGLGAEGAGFFLIPPINEGDTVLHVGGVAIPYGITTNAEDPDTCAAFIDSLVSEASVNAFLESGSLPAGDIPDDKIVAGTVSGDVYTGWNAAVAGDAVGHYLDWAAPGFYDVITGALQEILGGQVTAEEFVAKLQDFYAASFS